MAISTTRHALTQARKIAESTKIDEKIRVQLAQEMIEVAKARVANPSAATPGYGKLVYRVIAIALGAVAVLVVVFAFVLLLRDHTVDAAFYTVGSGAVGALGGVFSTSGAAGGTSSPAGTGTNSTAPADAAPAEQPPSATA